MQFGRNEQLQIFQRPQCLFLIAHEIKWYPTQKWTLIDLCSLPRYQEFYIHRLVRLRWLVPSSKLVTLFVLVNVYQQTKHNITPAWPHVSEFKKVLNCRFQAVDSGFQKLDSGLWQWNLDSKFQSLVLFRIPKPKFPNFHDCGIRVPLHGGTSCFRPKRIPNLDTFLPFHNA